MDNKFTHFDQEGNSRMVDVSHKKNTQREAIATGKIIVGKEVFGRIKDKNIEKGDVFTVAQIAGIMAMKETPRLIPLCHNINLQKSNIIFSLNEKNYEIVVEARVKTFGLTGVEMEALTGVNIALLTIYDMCKAINKRMVITDIHLVNKSGGKSGEFTY